LGGKRQPGGQAIWRQQSAPIAAVPVPIPEPHKRTVRFGNDGARLNVCNWVDLRQSALRWGMWIADVRRQRRLPE